MGISQLKGAAGVAINTVNLSGYPATANNGYNIGLVGWTPQGPSNKVTLIPDTATLYSLFGYPTNYSANQVSVLHAAKIILDAGAQVQLVRAVDGSGNASAQFTSEFLNYAAFELTQYPSNSGTFAAQTLDSQYTGNNLNTYTITTASWTTGTKYYTTTVEADTHYSTINNNTAAQTLTVASWTTGAVFYASPTGYSTNLILNNRVNNISNLNQYTLTAYNGVNSPFTAFLNFPGFTGYQLSLQTFQTFATPSALVGDAAHSLNLISGDANYSSFIGEFRNFVLGLGLYQDYQVVGTATSDLSGQYWLGGVSYSTTANGGSKYAITAPTVSATGDYFAIAATSTPNTVLQTLSGYTTQVLVNGINYNPAYTITATAWSTGTNKFYLTSGVYSTTGSGTAYTLSISLDPINGTYYALTDGTVITGFTNVITTGTYTLTIATWATGTAYYATDVAYSNYSMYGAHTVVNTATQPYPYNIAAYGDRWYATNNAFYRYNGQTLEANLGAPPNVYINTALNTLIYKFGVVRTYTSSTATIPLETLYITLGDYVTSSGLQLNIVNSGSQLLTFKANVAFTMPTTGWINATTSNFTLLGGNTLAFGTQTSQTSRSSFTPAWALFNDIVNVDVRLLVDGGCTIANFANDPDNTDMESVDSSTVTAMLNVSSYRNDAPSIFDLPKTRVASNLVKKFVRQYPSVGKEVNGSTASYATFWGNAQDGRQLINDTFNQKQIEVGRSVFKAVAVYNVFNTSYPWQTSWGPNRGAIQSPSVASLNPRTFPDDIGLLSKNRINPSKLTPNGEFFWDDWSLQGTSSVLQRWHAVMFLADVYRRYTTILDQYVAELNTPDLRKTIHDVLNEDLNFIKNVAKPAGLYDYYVICNDSNNPPSVIDADQLNVDIGMEIVRDTRVILLTNTLYRTGGIVASKIKFA